MPILEAQNTLPTLSIDDFKIVENNPWLAVPFATFTVKLSGVAGQTVTFDYATEDNTAIAGKDYKASVGSLVFNPGEQVKTITIPIIKDGKAEPSIETFDVVLSNPTNATLGDAVGTGTIVDGTYAYYKTTNPSTWTQAQAIAQSMGGNLVTINEAAENQFLVDTFGSEALWIGLTDAEKEGVWKWVNGETATYRNWYPGEPNNYLGIEDYAQINLPPNSLGLWNDFPNNPNDLGNPDVWSLIRGIVEVVEIKGTNAKDTVTGTDDAEAIEGLTGDDKILAKAGKDYLSGGAGKDTLDGGTGADVLKGGADKDTYMVDNAKDKVTEGVNQGTDLIKASVAQTLPVNVENLTLTGVANIKGNGNKLHNIITGNSGNNNLSGKEGNDTLDGKAGTDILVGGLGNDKYTVDSADLVTELPKQGSDVITASGNYMLPVNVEDLILAGTAANGMGNELNNIITGNASKNILIGNEGSDTIKGKAGNDILIGGVGNDFFVFDSSTQGLDIILEFTSGDKIRCSATGFGGGLVKGALPSSRFVVGTKALDANDRFIYNAGSLFYDVDGSGSTAQTQIATLIGAPALAASNIVIV